jgi:hypothetical protein
MEKIIFLFCDASINELTHLPYVSVYWTFEQGDRSLGAARRQPRDTKACRRNWECPTILEPAVGL